MTSAGGLKRPSAFRGFESVLSGPAGGVVGFARAAQGAGRPRAIGFDMGGTSTDVARFDGRFEYEYETQKAGLRLVAPTLAIETVAAGGGSICAFDGVKLTVGPASAGADPGPACYGRAGPLCVTDLNLYLGRLAAERFPFTPDRAAVEARLHELCRAIKQATGEMPWPSQVAEDLLAIANSNMARAIRGITVARGFDPREYALVAFGGAAGQHACAVARELRIREILHDADASLLSARGIAMADVTRHAAAGVARREGDVADAELFAFCDGLAAPLVDDVTADGLLRENIDVRASVDVRYVGVDATLNVPLAEGGDWRRDFEAAHRRQFGYVQADRAIEVAAARVEVIGRAAAGEFAGVANRASHENGDEAMARRQVQAIFGGGQRSIPVYERGELAVGACIVGPALVVDDFTTVVVEDGWTAEVLECGQLLLRDEIGGAAPRAAAAGAVAEREIFGNLLAGVAERMGHVLRRTALSVNVKERLDYSCGVFTAAGELAASAAHIPVHLGAMGTTVRAILAENPDMRPGDAFVTNNPYRGGSHLPDVTVVLPVYGDVAGVDGNVAPRLLFFTACRAHHAEIGGTRPGSIPPTARRLGEEGVVIDNFVLLRDGAVREAELRELLERAPNPSRAVEENIADLRAQLAAVQQGAGDLRELVRLHGRERIERQLCSLLEESELKVRAALEKLPHGDRRFVDYLETADGASTPVAVTLTLPGNAAGPAATFVFSGTGPTVDGNLNANPAIVSAAVLYVLRLLVDEEIPLNEGALRAVRIVLPECLLNPPMVTPLGDSPAVAAGNVETSQRVVDVLLGALGLAAASQGTMNNVLFGAAGFGFYETVCGGSGATADAPGASAVQVHMTNTRTTDPEVLERRLPVRLWEFSVRRGSGGAGAHRGGDGAVRRIEVLAPLELSLVTQRRGPHRPFGLSGGLSGALGENLLHRKNGATEQLPGIAECTVIPGDVLELRTPGGGGYGIAGASS
jgi:5-oxoprolinase (ATP-hydrolysing)